MKKENETMEKVLENELADDEIDVSGGVLCGAGPLAGATVVTCPKCGNSYRKAPGMPCPFCRNAQLSK